MLNEAQGVQACDLLGGGGEENVVHVKGEVQGIGRMLAKLVECHTEDGTPDFRGH